MIENNAYPSLLNFEGFPKSISSSVNNIAAHGIPDSRPLEEGDILNIDVTVFHDGFHGDVSDTFTVGTVDCHAEKLIRKVMPQKNQQLKSSGLRKLFKLD